MRRELFCDVLDLIGIRLRDDAMQQALGLTLKGQNIRR